MQTDENMQFNPLIEQQQSKIMLDLDMRIKKMDGRLVAARSKTQILLKHTEASMEMIRQRQSIANKLKQPDWIFFREITERWIRCLNGGGGGSNIKQRCDNESKIHSHQLSPNPVEKNNFKIARKIKYQSYHVARNVRKSSINKLRNTLPLRKLTEEEERQVDDILRKSTGRKTKSTNDYCLTKDEQKRCLHLDDQLKTFRDVDESDGGPRVRFCLDEKPHALNATRLAENEQIGPSYATIRASRIVEYVEDSNKGV